MEPHVETIDDNDGDEAMGMTENANAIPDNVRTIRLPSPSSLDEVPEEGRESEFEDVPPKRLNVKMPPSEYRTYQRIAKSKRITLSDLVRAALEAVRTIAQERAKGNRILVVDDRGRVQHELKVAITLF